MKKTERILIPLFAALSLTMTSCGSSVINEETTTPTTQAMTSAATEVATDPSAETTAVNSETETTTEALEETEPPVETQAPISTESYDERAQEILDTMSTEEKVGQMFIARCPESNGAADAASYNLGGYILFASDFDGQTKDSVSANIQSYQDSAKIDMLIGVDEEGGNIVRISKYSQFRAVPFWAPMDLYNSGGLELVRSDTEEKAKLLTSLGVNMNFAPVCDLPDSTGDYIYGRTFGTDVDVTQQGISTVVTEMNANRMISALKHFPGYGNNVDTHTGVATDERDYSEFTDSDFLPFESGISAGASSILVSHNIVTSMDANAPASLSAEVHRILREDLGFNGVIITDDLSMDAITEFAGSTQAAVLAVEAGNDLLCVDDYTTQVPAVIDAVNAGEISIDRIDESVLRLLKMKLAYGVIA